MRFFASFKPIFSPPTSVTMSPFLQGFIEYLPYATDIFDCPHLTGGRVKGLGFRVEKIERCKLTNIPQDICTLTNLTSLHFLHVLVEDFPESIESLVQIQTIHCNIPVTQNSDSHNLLKMVVNSLPMLVQLRQLLLLSPNQDDIVHIGNLLRAWPLPLLDTTHWHFGFSKQWHLFNLPRQAVRWNDHTIVEHWIIQQHKVLAFVCGQRKRLGLTSVVALSNSVSIFLIVDEICRHSTATKTLLSVANF